MAGGWGQKFDPKKSNTKSVFSSEVLKNSPDFFPSPKNNKQSPFSLSGVLGLGQTVEFGKKENPHKNWNKEFLGNVNYLQQQENQLLSSQQRQLEKSIKDLQSEIQQLGKATDNLEKNVEDVGLLPVVEFNEYQLNFLNRIRTFLINLRKNVNEANIWLESFNSKKKKRNYFWNTAKNKKKGGEQYLFSNEHSVSRSGS